MAGGKGRYGHVLARGRRLDGCLLGRGVLGIAGGRLRLEQRARIESALCRPHLELAGQS